MTATVRNYGEQGGARTVIGGSLDVVSGGELDIESGGALKIAGTAVSSNASELNTLDGVPADIVWTVGEESENAITVSMQVNDANGNAMTARSSVFVYLSDDANGDSLAATAPDGHAVGGTDGNAIVLVTDKAWMMTTEADGDGDFDIVESGAGTFYLIGRLPNGLLKPSGAITFAGV